MQFAASITGMLEDNLLGNDVYSLPAVKHIKHSWPLNVIALTIIPHLWDGLFIEHYCARCKYPLSVAYQISCLC